jgi:hypothetical protein
MNESPDPIIFGLYAAKTQAAEEKESSITVNMPHIINIHAFLKVNKLY